MTNEYEKKEMGQTLSNVIQKRILKVLWDIPRFCTKNVGVQALLQALDSSESKP